jgi:hypothetical protein
MSTGYARMLRFGVMKGGRNWLAGGALLLTLGCGSRSNLPAELSNEEFWRLFTSLSEPGRSVGMSENFVSNEPRVAENARFLRSGGGVFIGVGPEQNFTYIAQGRPRMAFIIDIRRENADLHLLYKALFELSANRVELVSRLFSRPVPRDLSSGAGADTIFQRFEQAVASGEQLARTRVEVRAHLQAGRRFPLEPKDFEAIDRALQAFHDFGPAITYWGSQTVDKGTIKPSYARLMTMPDLTGKTRSFLADEASFRLVKEMHARNAIVPIVGDFGGPDAIRKVGAYVREHGDIVSTFYGSNVAVYLTNQQMHAFCVNLSGLPVARESQFVDSKSVIPFAERLEACGIRRAGGQ